jgi:hypothetical protein
MIVISVVLPAMLARTALNFMPWSTSRRFWWMVFGVIGDISLTRILWWMEMGPAAPYCIGNAIMSGDVIAKASA